MDLYTLEPYAPEKSKIIMSDLRACPYQTREPIIIGSGKDGIVCRISNDLVAKMPWVTTDKEYVKQYNVGVPDIRLRRIDDLVKEYKIASILHSNNVNVPEPTGVFKINFRNKLRPAFVMQYLDGVNLFRYLYGLKEEEKEQQTIRLGEKYFQQKQHALDLGFLTNDEGTHNAIWTQDTEKVHIIDFVRWGFKTPLYFDYSPQLQQTFDNLEVEI